jgi:cytochrome c-type biogenesis protein CcmF
VILAFSLVVFGTFLTRSGMLSSVHTFNDTGMAPYFIVFIGIILVGSFGLLYFRSDSLKKSGAESLVSRESSFLLTMILLLASTMLILIGTVYPAFREAFTGVKLSLNASFFNTVNGPLFFLIILTVGICTMIGWKHSSLYQLFKKVLWPLVAAVIVAIVILVLWVRAPIVLIGIFVLTFVLSSIVSEFIRAAGLRNRIRGGGYLKSWSTLIGSNSQRYGGYIVHAGIVLMALGIIASSFYGTNKEGTLKVGDSIDIKQYSVKYEGLTSPDKTILTATLSVYQSGKFIKLMNAEKYFQKSQQQSVTEVAIRSTPIDDLYIILQDWTDNGATADFKVLVNPLVLWIWIGGGVFLIGGLITFWPVKKSSLVQSSQDNSNE